MRKARPFHVYKGLIISRCAINSSGMRWSCLGPSGYLKSDTLEGVKELIRESLKERKPCRSS